MLVYANRLQLHGVIPNRRHSKPSAAGSRNSLGSVYIQISCGRMESTGANAGNSGRGYGSSAATTASQHYARWY